MSDRLSFAGLVAVPTSRRRVRPATTTTTTAHTQSYYADLFDQIFREHLATDPPDVPDAPVTPRAPVAGQSTKSSVEFILTVYEPDLLPSSSAMSALDWVNVSACPLDTSFAVGDEGVALMVWRKRSGREWSWRVSTPRGTFGGTCETREGARQAASERLEKESV